jgi:hypothetical protein
MLIICVMEPKIADKLKFRKYLIRTESEDYNFYQSLENQIRKKRLHNSENSSAIKLKLHNLALWTSVFLTRTWWRP